tara:strand:+ start:502 stop:690 length:189 start_codon:yes stop_codon:yes gene_type:complete
MTTQQEALLTIEETAVKLRIDKVSVDPARTIRSLVSRGQLHGVRVGKFLLIKEQSVTDLIKG